MQSFFKQKLKLKQSQPALRSRVDGDRNQNQSTPNLLFLEQKVKREESSNQQLRKVVEDQRNEIQQLKAEFKRKDSAPNVNPFNTSLERRPVPNKTTQSYETEIENQKSRIKEYRFMIANYESKITDLNRSIEQMRKEAARYENGLEELHQMVDDTRRHIDQQKAQDDREKKALREEKELQRRQHAEEIKKRQTEFERCMMVRDAMLESERKKSQVMLADFKCHHEAEKRAAAAQRQEEINCLREQCEVEKRQAAAQNQHRMHSLEQEFEDRTRVLNEEITSQREASEQARLALNRTRNELNTEQRKARAAAEENATKSQQLEYVQQQCALLLQKSQESASTNARTKGRKRFQWGPPPKGQRIRSKLDSDSE